MRFLALSLLLTLVSCDKANNFWPYASSPAHQIIEHPNFTGRICFIGDTGMGNKEEEHAINVLAKQLITSKCQAVFHTGDIIYPRGISSSKDPLLQDNFLNRYKNILDANIPIYLALGNHDYQGHASAWLTVAKENRNVIMPDFNYIVKLKDTCFVILNTNVFDTYLYGWGEGHKALNKRKKELETFLQENWAYYRNTCKKRVAVAHHPYLSPENRNAKGELKVFFDTWVIGQFSALVTGHDHLLAYAGRELNTNLFISGAGSILAKRKVFQFDPSLPGAFTVTDAKKQNQPGTPMHGFIMVENDTAHFINESGDILRSTPF